jgi:RNA polymerase sigma factor (sigma-70 family)
MNLTDKENDRRTWQNFRNGNKAAFQKIYFDHYRFLYNYCRKYTHDAALVEDLLQDLFVTLLTRKDRLGDTDNIRFYLFSSIRRRLFKALNAREYKVTDLFDNNNPAFRFDEGVEPGYGDDEEQNRFLKLLVNSINNLGERQKEMVYLKYYTGLNSKEIAGVLGVSYQTVRNTLCNALIKIRKDFEDEIPKGRMVVLFGHFFRQHSF